MPTQLNSQDWVFSVEDPGNLTAMLIPCGSIKQNLTRRRLTSPLWSCTWNSTDRSSGRRRSSLVTSLASRATSDQVIFSGIQPTGVPHLGNYLGALQHWVRLQNSAAPTTRLLFSVVDLHAITVPQTPVRLKQWKRESLATLLAIGLDPDRSTLFYQSSVAAHSELMWILSCTSSMGYLSRMTQWKSKLSLPNQSVPDFSNKSRLKLGLFSYPVLQAADILVHRATHVPVGEDQSQHIEFARECVTNFNHAYGPHLVAPVTIMSSASGRVMSLQEPHLKMSKSHSDPRSRILITDEPDEIHRKVMAAVTDSMNSVSYDPGTRPGVSNLLQLLSQFDMKGRTAADLGAAYASHSLRDLKATISDTISKSLESVRKRYSEIIEEDEGSYLDHVQASGAKIARESAEATMTDVREAVGFQ